MANTAEGRFPCSTGSSGGSRTEFLIHAATVIVMKIPVCIFPIWATKLSEEPGMFGQKARKLLGRTSELIRFNSTADFTRSPFVFM